MRRRGRLIDRRKTVGLSQEKLAEAVGVDRITVVRWESGEFTPQPGQRPLLAKALAVSVEELHLLLTAADTTAVVKEPTAYPRLPGAALAWAGDVDRSSIGDQLPVLLGQLDALAGDDPAGLSPHRREAAYTQLVHSLAAWAHTVNRRELLRVLGWAATAAAGAPALHHLDEQESERVVLAVQAPQRVDGQVIDHIEAVLWRCARQDDLLGPQATLDTVLAQRSLVRSLLPEAQIPVRDRLLSAYGGLSRLPAGCRSTSTTSTQPPATTSRHGRPRTRRVIPSWPPSSWPIWLRWPPTAASPESPSTMPPTPSAGPTRPTTCGFGRTPWTAPSRHWPGTDRALQRSRPWSKA